MRLIQFDSTKDQPSIETVSKSISKNQDVTRLVNVRLRLRDLKVLDKWAERNHWSRTRAIEKLIEAHCAPTSRKASQA